MTLFVYPELDYLVPRSIRIHNITKNLKVHHNVNFRIYKYNIDKVVEKDSVIFSASWKFRLVKKLKITYFLRKLFPKTLSPDINNLFLNDNIKDIIEFINDNNVQNIIIVVYPFSSYKIVLKIREAFPDLNIILDIGDPLFNNADKSNRKNQEKNFKLEIEAVKNASKLIVTNLKTKEFYLKTYNIDQEKISIIPQGVDTELVKSVKSNLNNLNVEKLRLVYSGIFYKDLRSPENLFKAINSNNNINFDVYGSFIKRNISNVYFKNRLPQDELFEEQVKADILVFIDNAYGIQTSGKIFELLSFQKPILFIYSNEESETFNCIKHYENIIKVKNELKSIENVLNEINKDYLRNLNSSYDIEQFSWGNRSNLYSKILI